MKKTNIRFILCMLVAISSLQTIGAKTPAVTETDSLNNTDPLVNVAYRDVKKSNIMGGVSVINIEELLKKNYNTYSMDNMQGYVAGWNGNSLWGMDSHLVLVDGVPRDANNVLPTEIASITFLKSASAVVLYGSRGAKGVVSITTKRGKIADRQVSVRANTGYNVAKGYPKYLGSSEYMTLYNEALTNDGLATSYTDESIYNHSTGLNPYRYPNIDFYSSDYLKKAFNRTDVTAEITGGNDRAQFYTNISYFTQGDYFKFGEAKNNRNNRLNIRGNIDIKINDFIKAAVNANATFYDARGAKGNYWEAASTLRPNRFAPLIPISFIEENDLNSILLLNNTSNIIDGKYFLSGTAQEQTNIFADYYAAGYNKYTSRQFQFDTKIDFDLRKILKGLSFNTMLAIDYATT
ncbi:MAG: TonB-dependent receptor plug domain-containing protein, partial [Paludibacter sp.]